MKTIRSKPQQKVLWSHVDPIWPVYTLKRDSDGNLGFHSFPEHQLRFFYLKSFWTEGETVVGNDCTSDETWHPKISPRFSVLVLVETSHWRSDKTNFHHIFRKILIVFKENDIFWLVRSETLSWCNWLFLISVSLNQSPTLESYFNHIYTRTRQKSLVIFCFCCIHVYHQTSWKRPIIDSFTSCLLPDIP